MGLRMQAPVINESLRVRVLAVGTIRVRIASISWFPDPESWTLAYPGFGFRPSRHSGCGFRPSTYLGFGFCSSMRPGCEFRPFEAFRVRISAVDIIRVQISAIGAFRVRLLAI